MAYFTPAANLVHDATANLFGESCAWTPLAGGPEQVAQINFNRPDKFDALGDLHATEWEFGALDTWIEYRAPQFPTLHDSVANKANEEVTISDQNGTVIGTYLVTKVQRVWDGSTYKAQLVEL